MGGDSCNVGTFTVKDAGGDLGGSTDNFNFCYLSLTNDGAIVARLNSATWASGSAGKIGLLMRETTASGSKMTAILLDRSSTDTPRMPYRTSLNGGTSYTGSGPTGTAPPEWLKLQRVGSTFTTFFVGDGGSWTSLGINTLSSFCRSVSRRTGRVFTHHVIERRRL